jgi:hypothetical protein
MDVIFSAATSKLVGTLSIGQWTTRISRPARAATVGRSMRCHAAVAQPINATIWPLDSSRASQQNQRTKTRRGCLFARLRRGPARPQVAASRAVAGALLGQLDGRSPRFIAGYVEASISVVPMSSPQ